MLKFAADENFNAAIVGGLRRRAPEIDLVRVQDRGLSGAGDPVVLAWAADEGRVLLTHDKATISVHAFARVVEGHPMPGVIIVPLHASVGPTIDAVLLIAEVISEDEMAGQVKHIGQFQ